MCYYYFCVYYNLYYSMYSCFILSFFVCSRLCDYLMARCFNEICSLDPFYFSTQHDYYCRDSYFFSSYSDTQCLNDHFLNHCHTDTWHCYFVSFPILVDLMNYRCLSISLTCLRIFHHFFNSKWWLAMEFLLKLQTSSHRIRLVCLVYCSKI